jgi:hypothetical protein
MKAWIAILILLTGPDIAFGQQALWHNKEREIHYQPDGTDFTTINGKRKFTRALYGTNTGFRVEAGDLPEFALYMPGMGGNFKFGIVAGSQSIWLTEASYVKATYRPGSMLYEIRDSILGGGTMNIQILALADAEGFIIKTQFRNVKRKAQLVWVFGGASGKRFSRDGDVGADPESSFYLQEENCRDNRYQLDKNFFRLQYGSGKVLTEEERYEIRHLPAGSNATNTDQRNLKQLEGLFPSIVTLKLADASQQQTPAILISNKVDSSPVVSGRMEIVNSTFYYLVQNPAIRSTKNYGELPAIFLKAETARQKIAGRITLNTPDKYLNTLGGALSVAADAIWEDPSYLHGAVAWRMRLNAWRGAYVADPLGWHDRAKKHFRSYALSQVVTPAVTGVVMDTALHLARHLEKIGTQLFSDGYICRNPNGDIRAHHYDMNLVFVDQLLNHFNWTGDTAFVREMWPLIRRHLAWEKRNFDSDGDGLYDAYAAIWASDALQYSGGGVTHSSAYNFRSNKAAAELAAIIGEDGGIYLEESGKIFSAVQKELWLKNQGCYAEYKDLMGKQLIHPVPGLWTIYHAMDAKLSNPFQAYQSLKYIDNHIPHIPVKAKGLNEKGLYLLSTSNWQPYTWSINNVALGENLQTALAYWQGHRREEAFQLWRSTILESMYLSASPGGFQQLSFYDAIRGELYRDFADGIGVAGRTLVEGLFGVQPDALRDTICIQPGFPASWNYASLKTPDIDFDFKRNGNTDSYVVRPAFPKKLHLRFRVDASHELLQQVFVNGKAVEWVQVENSIGCPVVELNLSAAKEYRIAFLWKGVKISSLEYPSVYETGDTIKIVSKSMELLEVYDPQNCLINVGIKHNILSAQAANSTGKHTFFVKVGNLSFSWWEPINLELKARLPFDELVAFDNTTVSYEKIDLVKVFNEKVTNIFKQQYLSPRPYGPTLQLPTQGIGNWCYPLTMANIEDGGLRQRAGIANEIRTTLGIPFFTPSNSALNNIVFTSQWDNYPDSVVIPMDQQAFQINLLMAGTTNPMQSRITNGMVIISYEKGNPDTLLLENPSNWWPIEQDYYEDGFAFTTGMPFPERLYLKDGTFGKGLKTYSVIKGFSNRGIDGGAATVLSFPIDNKRKMRSLALHAVANDVVIGLMAVTLSKN